ELWARLRPPGASRISGIVTGRPATDSAATIAFRLAVTRWLARRSLAATVSLTPSDTLFRVVPATCEVYGEGVAASRAGTVRGDGGFADRRRIVGACDDDKGDCRGRDRAFH